MITWVYNHNPTGLPYVWSIQCSYKPLQNFFLWRSPMRVIAYRLIGNIDIIAERP